MRTADLSRLFDASQRQIGAEHGFWHSTNALEGF
jgi:hypothetical protein